MEENETEMDEVFRTNTPLDPSLILDTDLITSSDASNVLEVCDDVDEIDG